MFISTNKIVTCVHLCIYLCNLPFHTKTARFASMEPGIAEINLREFKLNYSCTTINYAYRFRLN